MVSDRSSVHVCTCSVLPVALLASFLFGAPPEYLSAKRHFQSSPNSRKVSPTEDSLKIESSDNLIFLPVRVNGSRPLRFALDTGSDKSVLSDKRAEELGIQFTGEHDEIIGIGDSKTEARVATSVLLQIGVFQMIAPRIWSVSLKEFDEDLGWRVDGILGADFFQRFVVDIDYVGHQLRIYEPATYNYPSHAQVIPLIINSDGTFIRMTAIVGHHSVNGKFLIDTGAGHTVTFSPQFVKENGLTDLSNFLPRLTGGLGGDSKIMVGRIEELQIGTFVLSRPTGELSVDPASGLTSGVESGVIGAEVLRRFRVVFDYSRSNIILRPSKAYSEPFEVDMSGVSFVSDGEDLKTIRIERVYENSPAALAQLQPNDVILSINNKSASNLSLEVVRNMFRKPNKTYRLLVKRSERTFEISLRTNRLV